MRPRTVLSPAAVERAVEQGGDAALRTLVATEVQLAVEPARARPAGCTSWRAPAGRSTADV